MLKIAAIVSLFCIMSSVWAAGLSCDSCGSECSPACGTRRFRACCFNYLRRKRGSEALKFHKIGEETKENLPKLVLFNVENMPEREEWIDRVLSNENQPYHKEYMTENYLM